MTEKEIVTFVKSLEDQAMARWNKNVESLANSLGTPQTLLKAIRNGLNEAMDYPEDVNKIDKDPEEIILKHVKDFLSQKFTPFMAGDGSVIDCTSQALWEKIIKNDE